MPGGRCQRVSDLGGVSARIAGCIPRSLVPPFPRSPDPSIPRSRSPSVPPSAHRNTEQESCLSAGDQPRARRTPACSGLFKPVQLCRPAQKLEQAPATAIRLGFFRVLPDFSTLPRHARGKRTQGPRGSEDTAGTNVAQPRKHGRGRPCYIREETAGGGCATFVKKQPGAAVLHLTGDGSRDGRDIGSPRVRHSAAAIFR